MISVQGKKHYLRLTSLPPGVVILQVSGTKGRWKDIDSRQTYRQDPIFGKVVGGRDIYIVLSICNMFI